MTFCSLTKFNDNLPPIKLYTNPIPFYRTRPFTEVWEISTEHLWRVWHADRGRLLLRTPGPVPFATCICSTCWNQFFSRTCHYFSGLCYSNIPRYFLDFACSIFCWNKGFRHRTEPDLLLFLFILKSIQNFWHTDSTSFRNLWVDLYVILAASIQIYNYIVSRICFNRNHSSGLLRWSNLQTKEGQRDIEFQKKSYQIRGQGGHLYWQIGPKNTDVEDVGY